MIQEEHLIHQSATLGRSRQDLEARSIHLGVEIWKAIILIHKEFGNAVKDKVDVNVKI